jgi:branched-chain amino acid transport system substrate-binding protein
VSFLIGILLALTVSSASAQPRPIVVGAVVSETGVLATLAADYRKGLILWAEEVNGAGGLLGRRLELRLRDDGSEARRSGELYVELMREQADLLIGPFGSAATLMASAQTEREQRVLINGAGPSLAVHKRAPRYLFQTTISNAAYGVGVLELAKAEDLASLALVARNEQGLREMADAAHEQASRQEFKAGEVEVYAGSAADFLPYVARARAGYDGWIAFAEVRDTAEMLRTFRKLDYAPRLFFASAAADPKLIELVGQDAEFALGVKEYDPKFPTQGNHRFAAAYAARWSSPPTYAAAQGYAAGTVLAEAVNRSKSLDQAKLRAVLAQMETDTVLGGYKVDPRTGEQRATRPAVVQIQRGKPQVVWPEWLQTSTLRPYAPWSERILIR